MALPRTAVTLTWMTLPPASRDDLAGMVELEAAQMLPFAVEEAAWDFAASPADVSATTYDAQPRSL